MLLQMALFHSFLWLNNISLCICTTSFFLYSSDDGHLDCFHVLAIMNSAAVNIVVHVSFQLWFSLDICLGVGWLDYMVALFLVF